MSAATLRWQRWLVLAALVGSTLIVWWWDGDDNFALPKATFLVLVAVALLWCTAVRWSWTRRIVVPRSAPLAAVGVFTVGLVISTLTSTSRLQSVVGQYQQYDGLATYLACAVVFVATVRSFRNEHLLWLLRAFVVAMVGVAGLGLLEVIGADPAKLWSSTPQIVSTLGNQNFVAGWLAVAIGPCIVLAAWRDGQPGWRLAAAFGAVGGVVVLVAADSFQGPIAGGLAILVAGAAVVLVRRPLERWWTRRNLVLAAAGMTLLVVAVGVVGWSFIHHQVDEGLYDRRAFWSAAVHVLEDHPLAGTGPDTFHNQFLQRRPVGHVGNNAGAAHDVPLDMLANGGLVTGLPYLAFLGLTLVALVRVWRRARGRDVLLVGGLAAAWVGYVVQSLVSIDRPGLVITHWVVAGVIAAMAVTYEPIVLTLPGALEGRRQARRGPGWLVPAGLASIVAVVAVVPLTRPIRATAAVAASSHAVRRGDIETAIAQVEKGRSLAPWEAHHTFSAAQVYAVAQRPKEFIAEVEAGARLAPGDATYAIAAAQGSLAAGDQARAVRWWAEAVRRDPYGLETINQAGDAAAKRRDRTTVEQLIPKLHRINDLSGWLAAGRWYAALSDRVAARAAYEHILRLDPGYGLAKKGLADLDQ